MNRVLPYLILSIGLCSTVFAQAVSTAQISGTVTDASGLAVPGAEVKATHADTGAMRMATTGGDGGYILTNLPVGPYQLQVSKEGLVPPFNPASFCR